ILDIGYWILSICKTTQMEKVTNLPLEDLEIYQLALEIGDYVWKMVNKWEFFPKKTVGGQFVEAADSIASNIAEGYGRYFYKDRKQFFYLRPGLLIETKTWATKRSEEHTSEL